MVKALRVAKEELSRAVKYCQDKNVCGYSAVKTGLFPSIKDARTINKQLDEPTSTTKSKRIDCKILSDIEEQALVPFLKNKSHSMQGAARAEGTKYIRNILCVSEYLNKQCKRGWAYQLISDNREKFLAKGKLSKSFWQRFGNDYPSPTRKRKGHHSAKSVCMHRGYGEPIFR